MPAGFPGQVRDAYVLCPSTGLELHPVFGSRDENATP